MKEPWIIENCYPVVGCYVINIIEFLSMSGGPCCYSWIFGEILMSVTITKGMRLIYY